MTARCPTCRGPSHKDGNKLYPFCSERCHLVDLGRWLGEEYRVPDRQADEQEDGLPPQRPTDA
jgi:endogenous inhibitor of DNA gyrase (YacG/DUF329 family)